MNYEPVERDAALERALRQAVANPAQDRVNWAALSDAVTRRAAPELARRRLRHRLIRVAIPAALAASLALFVLASRPPDPTNVGRPSHELAASPVGEVTVDELLDADVSDVQFRALLFGATEADELLLIAAEEERQ